MVWSSASRSTPSPEVALAWGSQSMRSTRRPRSARAAPRLMAVVVLPTPPFWLTTAMIRLGTLGRDYAAGTGGPRRDPAPRLRRGSFARVFHAPVEGGEFAWGVAGPPLWKTANVRSRPELGASQRGRSP